MNASEVTPAHHPAGTVTGPLTRTGPEVPPDVADAPITTRPGFGTEPTQQLPQIQPVPRVQARAVIVYEPEPRPRRGLWVFTGLLVALTTGVVLGQAAAYQPAARSLPAAQVQASSVAPPEVLASPPAPVVPLPGHRITAPLGSATERLLEVTGAATPLRIGSADLGDLLFSVATVDGSTVPTVVQTARGPRLSVARAGAATGAAGAEVQLNAKVRWTVRVTGRAGEQVIDLRAGGLAAIELTGDPTRVVLALPPATGTLAFRIAGAVADLRIRTGDDVPVRLRLRKGADRVTVDTTRRDVRPGGIVSSRGWQSAVDRYDIAVSARVGSIAVERTPSRAAG
ncbi:MAG TPA: hypothetical protein VFH03_00020 [Actinoplanes sp.]|nr:hypothetical protein [Actinoplanes sp.]